MRQNWWLIGQVLGAVGAAARLRPLAGQAQRALMDWTNLPAVQLPPATIIIPARNEERVIERCVRSLLAQDYPDFELIVVDDGSQDATPRILARLAAQDRRLKVVTLDGKLPPGWAGKPHAMQRGYEAARPDSQWILFSDADTYHEPAALRSAVTVAIQERGDLLSLLPRMELESFWEKVLMPFVVMGILAQYPLDTVNRPDSKVAIANGQFLLLRRTAFERVGGYGGRLKNSLLDDRDMALVIKGQGGKILLKNGQKLVAVRMYTGLGEIWRGFGKNAFVGSRMPYLSVPFFIVAGLVFGVLPALQLLYGLGRWLTSGGKQGQRLMLYSAIPVGLNTLSRRPFDRMMGVAPVYSASGPLAMLVFAGVMTDSMVRSIMGQGVSWKGRNYAGAAKTQQIIR